MTDIPAHSSVVRNVYWIATLVMCGIFTMSASMYLQDTDTVRGYFDALRYPDYLVLPLAYAKVAGILVMFFEPAVMRRSGTNSPIHQFFVTLKEWAYAGFFFDALLALTAHLMASDGGYSYAAGALILVVVSRLLWKQAYPDTQ